MTSDFDKEALERTLQEMLGAPDSQGEHELSESADSRPSPDDMAAQTLPPPPDDAPDDPVIEESFDPADYEETMRRLQQWGVEQETGDQNDSASPRDSEMIDDTSQAPTPSEEQALASDPPAVERSAAEISTAVPDVDASDSSMPIAEAPDEPPSPPAERFDVLDRAQRAAQAAEEALKHLQVRRQESLADDGNASVPGDTPPSPAANVERDSIEASPPPPARRHGSEIARVRQRILDEAEEEARRIIDDSREDARAAAERTRDQIIADARQEAEAMHQEAQSIAEELRADVENERTAAASPPDHVENRQILGPTAVDALQDELAAVRAELRDIRESLDLLRASVAALVKQPPAPETATTRPEPPLAPPPSPPVIEVEAGPPTVDEPVNTPPLPQMAEPPREPSQPESEATPASPAPGPPRAPEPPRQTRQPEPEANPAPPTPTREPAEDRGLFGMFRKPRANQQRGSDASLPLDHGFEGQVFIQVEPIPDPDLDNRFVRDLKSIPDLVWEGSSRTPKREYGHSVRIEVDSMALLLVLEGLPTVTEAVGWQAGRTSYVRVLLGA